MGLEDPLGAIEVEVKDENIVQAQKKLRKEMGREGIISKMQDMQHYTKPSKERHDRKKKVKRRMEKQKEED